MYSFFSRLIKSVGVLGLWLMLFPSMGATYEPIQAELTANTNLRESPDINGKIIVVLKRWDRILIQDENQHWAHVIYEKNGDNLKGWVSSKFLLKTPTAPQDLKTRDLEDKSANQASRSFPDTGFTSSAPPPDRIVEASGQQRTIVSEPLPPPEKSVVTKTTKPLSGEDINSFFNDKVNTSLKADDPNLALRQTTSNQDIIEGITRILFKISLIIMSCVALIFSYSALEIAKSYRYIRLVDDK